MDSDRWREMQSVFIAAIDLARDERPAFLDEACGGDVVLRREVGEMLNAHDTDGALAIEGRLVVEERVDVPASEVMVNARVGSYRVRELVGHGGMGEVYLAARDDDHYTQDVALKLVRSGAHTSETVRRFRAERQILARLVHPNIARLLDGGVSDDGRPYLVMEYVDGVPLTEFCDKRRLSIEARLRLFRTVCTAVQFAHRNLVVHRDLKPSNILVTRQGEVKLLDFGIAKLLDPEAVGMSVALTQTELKVMTPEYAAPEQVRGEAITTATDVYALGILLYELLTGHRPYRLSVQRRAEFERIICEDEPTRPSTVVTEIETVPRPDGSAEPLTPERVSAERATHAARLRRTLRGDLDNIVMMSLRKEPDRRYASAEQMGEDIQRYLERRPIIARTDKLTYRLRKFVRRNRVGVGGAAAFVLLLLASTVVTAWQGWRVARERDVAREEAAKAEQVTAFLLGLFDSAAPMSAPRDTIRVRDVLELGRERAEALSEQPAVQAELLSVVSEAYWRLGRYDRATTLAEQALDIHREFYGPEHPETAMSLYRLAGKLGEREQHDRAAELYRESVEALRAAFGERHNAVVRAVYGLGIMLHHTGRNREADSLFATWATALAEARLEDDPELANNLGRLGEFLHYGGRLEEAESYLRRAIAMKRRLYGDRDVRTGSDLNRLTQALLARRQSAEAETIAREALELHRQVYPEGHMNLVLSVGGLGEAFLQQERYAEAEPYLQEALTMTRSLVGDDHSLVSYGLAILARLYHRWGHYDDAESYYRQDIELFERRWGTDYVLTIERREMLADLLRDRGDYADAERILLQARETLQTQRGADDRFTRSAVKRLVELYEAWGRPDRAEAYRVTG